MEKLTFWELLREARIMKKAGIARAERHLALGFWILGAKYYYVEQG